jgi:hypothetical protein
MYKNTIQIIHKILINLLINNKFQHKNQNTQINYIIIILTVHTDHKITQNKNNKKIP